VVHHRYFCHLEHLSTISKNGALVSGFLLGTLESLPDLVFTQFLDEGVTTILAKTAARGKKSGHRV